MHCCCRTDIFRCNGWVRTHALSDLNAWRVRLIANLFNLDSTSFCARIAIKQPRSLLRKSISSEAITACEREKEVIQAFLRLIRDFCCFFFHSPGVQLRPCNSSQSLHSNIRSRCGWAHGRSIFAAMYSQRYCTFGKLSNCDMSCEIWSFNGPRCSAVSCFHVPYEWKSTDKWANQ